MRQRPEKRETEGKTKVGEEGESGGGVEELDNSIRYKITKRQIDSCT
jgi:hypothetical protein